jgi:hypothetical protein
MGLQKRGPFHITSPGPPTVFGGMVTSGCIQIEGWHESPQVQRLRDWRGINLFPRGGGFGEMSNERTQQVYSEARPSGPTRLRFVRRAIPRPLARVALIEGAARCRRLLVSGLGMSEEGARREIERTLQQNPLALCDDSPMEKALVAA